jgi:8-oxo-dGTP pyrophosphatase MutT (NUDIX family)
MKTCLKCGINGHTNKNCNNEATSFGIVAYKHGGDKGRLHPFHQTECDIHSSDVLVSHFDPDPSEPDEILFLLVERKDTIGFINLIWGTFTQFEPLRTAKISKYISQLTCSERHRMKTSSFEELWSTIGSDRRDFSKAREKWFRTDWNEFLEAIPCGHQEGDFIMPKGRLKFGETTKECAIREFSEETGYKKNDLSILNVNPHEERFIGTDGRWYKNVFYVAKMISDISVTVSLGDDENQSREVRNIGWFDKDECKDVMRSYDTRKLKIIQSVYSFVTNSPVTRLHAPLVQ